MKKYTLLQLFSLVDGRLSTSMDDVYDMLGYICKFEGIMTHHLPTALKYIEEVEKPEWWDFVQNKLDEIKDTLKTNDFETLIAYIRNNNDRYEVFQITDEKAFGDFMVENSLLKTIGSKA